MLYNTEWDIDPAGKILLNAADRLLRHGWCQGYLSDGSGRNCMVGAIQKSAAAHVEGYGEAFRRLSDYLRTVAIVDWNDTVCKSKEEAIDALRAAAFSQVTA